MNTQKKIAAVYFLSVILLTAIAMFLFRVFLLQDFARLEKRMAASGLSNSYKLLQSQGERISHILKDYAAWTNTCVFIRELNSAYRQENLRPEVFNDLDVNFMVFLDAEGNWREGVFYNDIQKTITEFPEALKKYIMAKRELWTSLKIGNSISGFIRPQHELMSICAAPVSSENRVGPIHGYMLMGRRVTLKDATFGGSMSQKKVALEQYPSLEWPNLQETGIRTIGGDRILLACPVLDISRQPVMILVYAEERSVYNNGVAAVNRFVVWFLCSAVMLFLIMALFLHYAIFSPIRTASSRIRHFMTERHSAGESVNKDKEALPTLIEMAERSLGLLEEESTAREKIISDIPVGILIVDSNRIIREVNRMALRMCGYDSPQELIGKPCEPLFCRDQKCSLKENAPLNGEYLETYIFNKEGLRIPVLKTASHININGEMLFFEGFIDLTVAGEAAMRMDRYHQQLEKMFGDLQQMNNIMHQELENHRRTQASLLKAKEETVVSDKLKSAFLSNLSDELRTPLNALMGFAELLQDPALSAEERNLHLKSIYQSAKKLFDLLNQIIDFSKLESGMVRLNQEPLRLELFLSELLVQESKKYSDRREIVLRMVHPDGDESLVIEGDHDWLSRAIGHLLENAYKFTRIGQIELGYCRENADSVRIFVRDSGIGIEAGKQKAIFDLFAQGESFPSRHYGGIGFGLALCNRVVNMMGGRIWVESNPGRGSCFNLVFPCRR